MYDNETAKWIAKQSPIERPWVVIPQFLLLVWVFFVALPVVSLFAWLREVLR